MVCVLVLDCYTRTSIGFKLSNANIASQIEVESLTECEEQCSKNGNACSAFTFGVGPDGNRTCGISTRIPTLQDLESHLDYDVYVKNQYGSTSCIVDRLYQDFTLQNKSLSIQIERTNREERVANIEAKATQQGTGALVSTISLSIMTDVSFPVMMTVLESWTFSRIETKVQHRAVLSTYTHIWFSLTNGYPMYLTVYKIDHMRSNNERCPSSSLVHLVPSCTIHFYTRLMILPCKLRQHHERQVISSLIQLFLRRSDKSIKMFKKSCLWDLTLFFLCLCTTQSSMILKSNDDNDFIRIYEKEASEIDVSLYHSTYIHTFIRIHLLIECTLKYLVTICHRKLQPGKRTMDLHIERTVICENIQDCRRACDYENTFICNGYNYRRGTNSSKDICELTSTPYYRMNVDKDFLMDSRYDYYERDQYCLTSIPDRDIPHWMIRSKPYDEQNRRDSWTEFNHEDLASRQDSTLNWHGNWRGSHLGPRINYNHEYSDTIKPSTLSKSQFEDRSLSREVFNPQESEHFYGKFYNYGSAFGYSDDNYAPATKDFHPEEHEKLPELKNKCLIRLAAGSKLSRNVLRKTCLARDLKQCEDFCSNELSYPCESFAFRYNILTTNPTDNCLLSDLSYQDINFYTDLEPDRDYDTYIMSSSICHSKETTNRYPSGHAEECFSRIKSGFSIPTDITKKSVFTNDLGECQYACVTSQEFVCRSFAFKYATRYHGHSHIQKHAAPNCFLSDWLSGEMNPASMLDMDGAELYERNSFSYDCDAYPLPLSLATGAAAKNNGKGSAPVDTDEICYSQHYRPCKLMPHAIASSTRAITKSECCRKCSTMRIFGSIPCMSFNYMIITDNARDNCLLSNIPERDLRPHLDYVYDDDYMLYTWKNFDPYCSLTIPPITASVSNMHKQSFSPTPIEQDIEGMPGSEISSHRLLFDSLHRMRIKSRPKSHEQEYEHDYETNTDLDSGPRLVSDVLQYGIGSYPYPRELSTFRRYTVNGYPCKNNSVCQRNEIAGFWSCEIEENDGEYNDSWDYCCEPNHRCGFSQGYSYPWCYVGSNDDQWRPCSETYHPYYSPKDHRSSHSQPSAYLARHWPVIYLHQMLPPNCTANSFGNQYLNQNRRNVRRNNFQ
ncbi:uncharacterized protein LOC143183512 [Calliopsis andreniformis]|uniref:uncharacterized protein LOC143183512 n=1 Tax=Calliopsis andreniformis TaxID=337506 RepID=UPI003FCCC78C